MGGGQVLQKVLDKILPEPEARERKNATGNMLSLSRHLPSVTDAQRKKTSARSNVRSSLNPELLVAEEKSSYHLNLTIPHQIILRSVSNTPGLSSLG